MVVVVVVSRWVNTYVGSQSTTDTHQQQSTSNTTNNNRRSKRVLSPVASMRNICTNYNKRGAQQPQRARHATAEAHPKQPTDRPSVEPQPAHRSVAPFVRWRLVVACIPSLVVVTKRRRLRALRALREYNRASVLIVDQLDRERAINYTHAYRQQQHTKHNLTARILAVETGQCQRATDCNDCISLRRHASAAEH